MNEKNSEVARILIVDDEATAVENLAYVCRKAGYNVTTRTSGRGAIEALEKHRFDVVLSDLKMEQADGMAVLRQAKKMDPDIAVVIITGYATLDSAVKAMKAGAFHYIAKPFRLEEVREVIRSACELVQLKRENQALKNQISQQKYSDTFISQAPNVLRLLEMARQTAPTNTNVFISGESGTGKELLARYVHAHSDRSEKVFLAVNCGALQDELLANELFGHEKGAFTGAEETRKGLIEAADGGTLFLDEIGEMSLAMQVKLLRVIQEREVLPLGATKAIPVNIRLITATHRNLLEEVDVGRFRQDLYYRLDVVGLHLPPLSERRNDIPMLAYYFLRKHASRMGREIEDIEPAALAVLQKYPFPGNIRELENIIERAVTLMRGKQLSLRDFPATISQHNVHVIRKKGGRLPTLAEREAEYIQYVLDQSGQNRTNAAKILGIDRVSLWRKLKRYGLVDEV